MASRIAVVVVLVSGWIAGQAVGCPDALSFAPTSLVNVTVSVPTMLTISLLDASNNSCSISGLCVASVVTPASAAVAGNVALVSTGGQCVFQALVVVGTPGLPIVLQVSVLSAPDSTALVAANVGVTLAMCPPGTKLVGSNSCIACANGLYSSTYNSATCNSCNFGQVANAWVGATTCSACPTGLWASDAVTCSKCPVGQFTLMGYPCIPCAPGQIPGPTGANCNSCLFGYIASNGICSFCGPTGMANGQQTACSNCPAGTYSNYGINCPQCPAGQYSTNAAGTCQSCPPGQYTADHMNCVYCAGGSVPNLLGSACVNCSAGWIASPGQTACTPCGSGTYTTDGVTCKNCTAGQIPNAFANGCTPCSNGHISSPGQATCTACDPSQYTFDNIHCINCAVGNVPNLLGSGCTACAAGWVAMPGQSVCSQCGIGLYANNGYNCTQCAAGSVPNGLQIGCSPCGAGLYALSGQSSCSSCGSGQYTSDNINCLTCSPGNVPNLLGANCTACQPGYIAAPGQSTCTQCGSGTFTATGYNCTTCPAGSVPNSLQAGCNDCPDGNVASSGLSVCATCGSGKYTADNVNCLTCEAGSIPNLLGSTCTTCAAGWIAAPGESICTQCGPGTYTSNGYNCTACAAGSAPNSLQTACVSCAAGSVASPGNPGCTPCQLGQVSTDGVSCSNCPSGQVPFGNLCTPCPAGSVALAGQSTCQPCGAGTFTLNNIVCGPCPTGSVPGSSGSSCVPCAKGYIAVPGQSVCTQCGAGTYTTNGFNCTECMPGSQPTNDQSGCQTCPAGTYSASGLQCVTCTTGYSVGTGATSCSTCASGLVCGTATGEPLAQPGYWVAVNASGSEVAAAQCPFDWCTGGQLADDTSAGTSTNGCKAHHLNTSALCGGCDTANGYQMWDGDCRLCTATSVAPDLIVLYVAMFCYVCWLYYFVPGVAQTGAVSTVVFVLQTLGLLVTVYSTGDASSAASSVTWINGINLEVSFGECPGALLQANDLPPFYVWFWLKIAQPFVLLAMMGLLAIVSGLLHLRGLPDIHQLLLAALPVALQKRADKFFDNSPARYRISKVAVDLMMFCYLPVLKAVFTVFHLIPTPTTNELVLAVDPSVTDSQPMYHAHVIVAAFICVLYLPAPVVLWYTAVRAHARDAAHDIPSVGSAQVDRATAIFGSILHPFEPHMTWVWILLELRKVVVLVLVVFLGSFQIDLQNTLLAVLFVGMLLLLNIYRPLRIHFSHLAETAGLAMLIVAVQTRDPSVTGFYFVWAAVAAYFGMGLVHMLTTWFCSKPNGGATLDADATIAELKLGTGFPMGTLDRKGSDMTVF